MLFYVGYLDGVNYFPAWMADINLTHDPPSSLLKEIETQNIHWPLFPVQKRQWYQTKSET